MPRYEPMLANPFSIELSRPQPLSRREAAKHLRFRGLYTNTNKTNLQAAYLEKVLDMCPDLDSSRGKGSTRRPLGRVDSLAEVTILCWTSWYDDRRGEAANPRWNKFTSRLEEFKNRTQATAVVTWQKWHLCWKRFSYSHTRTFNLATKQLAHHFQYLVTK